MTGLSRNDRVANLRVFAVCGKLGGCVDWHTRISDIIHDNVLTKPSWLQLFCLQIKVMEALATSIASHLASYPTTVQVTWGGLVERAQVLFLSTFPNCDQECFQRQWFLLLPWSNPYNPAQSVKRQNPLTPLVPNPLCRLFLKVMNTCRFSCCLGLIPIYCTKRATASLIRATASL